MAAYDVKGKIALVTGAGSGINLTVAQRLLAAGCSVMFADLALRPEAEAVVAQYSHPAEEGAPSAVFHKVDLADWAQLSALFAATLSTFGRLDILVNGAGVFEPPWSCFWHPPGVSSLAKDDPDASVGSYKTFAINAMAPIRLAQLAIDYWLQNKETVKGGNLLWVASMGGYIHSIQTPLYLASKAAVVSFCKSLQGLNKLVGIRNSTICPAAVRTPIFDPDYCKDRLGLEDVALSSEDVADAMMELLTEPQYGHGTILEIMMIGTKEEPVVHKAEVQMEKLYPTVMPISEGTKALEMELKFMQGLATKGMSRD